MMLDVSDLRVRYGRVEALHGVSLRVDRGEIVAVVGPNGAGKSTLMKAIMGLVPTAAGSITFEGGSLAGLAPYRITARRIALVPEGRRAFPDQSVRDNLLLGAYTRLGRKKRHSVAEDIEKMESMFPRLRERMSQRAGTLSGGEQQMLVMARALMSRPQLLLMDEPSLGLAPIRVQEVFQVLTRLRDEGLTILLVEQMAWMALEICDRAYVLSTGALAREGTGAELLAHPELLEAYLGRKGGA